MHPQVSIDTDRVHVAWRGPLVPTERGLAVTNGRGQPVSVTSSLGRDALAEVGFAEEAGYRVWAEGRTGERVEVRHADPVVTAALQSERGGSVVTGTVRFGSHVGRTRFLVTVGGRAELAIEADVAPRKVTLATVHAMRDEVEAAWAGVPLQALRPTYEPQQPDAGTVQPSPAWLALLRAAMASLDTSLRAISHRPVAEIERRRQLVRASRVRRADAAVRASARRAGGALPALVEAHPARGTPDTPAHRWLAARLARVLTRVRGLARDLDARPDTARHRALRAELTVLSARVRRLAALDPFATAAASAAPAAPPLALRRRPAYAEAYTALRQLDGGLRRAEGEVRPSLLDLAGLYEAWCALALVRAVADVLQTPAPPTPFGLVRTGLGVRLRRGRRSALTLSGRGVHVEVAYSPRFADPRALLAQRPDFLLTVRGATTCRVVLDAKYRRDDRPASAARYGVAPPPADALGVLHRYRDAILGPDGAPGWIDEAVALFPPADLSGYASSRLWTGLATIGIGALPLVPGETAWLRRWLDERVASAAAGSGSSPAAPRS